MRSNNPIEVLENVTVNGRRLDGAGPATVDIGGWVAMPYEHFQAMRDAIQKERAKSE